MARKVTSPPSTDAYDFPRPLQPSPPKAPEGSFLIGPDPVKVKRADTPVPEGYSVFTLQPITFDAELPRREIERIGKLQSETDALNARLMGIVGEMPEVSLLEFATEANATRSVLDIEALAEAEGAKRQQAQLRRESLSNPEATAEIKNVQWQTAILQAQIAAIYWGLPWAEVEPLLEAPGAFITPDYSKGFIPRWLTETARQVAALGNEEG